MMEPLISVIVPVYKVEKYLKDCVDSILLQSYKNLEIILIDDGSPDNCGKICDEYKERDSRIIVIHKENGGLSDARNAGLDICKGEYIAFVDSDDIVSPIFISTLFAVSEQMGSDIVTTTYNHPRFVDAEKTQICFPESVDITSAEIVDNHRALELVLYQTIPNGVPFRLYKRYVFDDLRFPKGWLFEDVATLHNAFIKANKITVIDAPLYAYRVRSDSIVRMKFSESKMIVIPVTQKLYKDIMSYDKSLYAAVCSRAFAQNYHVFLQIPFDDRIHLDQVWNEMKKYYKVVLHDNNSLVRWKNRIGAMTIVFGKPFAYYAGRLYLRIRN